MSVFSGVATSAAQKATEKLRIEEMKKGKTEEQRRVIDFFLADGGGGCGSRSYASSLSFDDYVKLVQDKCNQLNSKARAIAQIGLDESQIQEISPVMLASFVYDDDALIKVTDQVAVSSKYSITWIFFSASQIYTYKYMFDTTSDNTIETMKDFFYSDITCFTTTRVVKEKIDNSFVKGCLTSKEQVAKSCFTVDTFEIIVPGTSYSFAMRQNADMAQSLQAAKAMLREKKFAN